MSLFDTTISVIFGHTSKIFDILRVFRLVRALRPLRVINRAPGLKLVVQTLLSSLKPIGNIVLICCTFFIIFGILGVQVPALFFFYLYYNSSNLVIHCFKANSVYIIVPVECVPKVLLSTRRLQHGFNHYFSILNI